VSRLFPGLVPTRTEDVIFRFALKHGPDCEAAKKVFEMDVPMAEGDELRFHYKFTVDYFGNIVARFEELIRLMDAGHVVTANMEERVNQDILFKRLVAAYFRITGDDTLPFAEEIPDEPKPPVLTSELVS
jgi:hypothetical protein